MYNYIINTQGGFFMKKSTIILLAMLLVILLLVILLFFDELPSYTEWYSQNLLSAFLYQ